MKNLMDRVVVITGAASGMGRALAFQLAREGCRLALVDINQKGLEKVKSEISVKDIHIYTVDVAQKDKVDKAVQQILSDFGRAHLLINCAGVAIFSGLEKESLEDFEWLVGVNFWGTVYFCKFLMPHLKKEEEAHIVNMSSVLGLVGVIAFSSYCATKYAIRGFTESLWEELKYTSVRVTCVHPGAVHTGIGESIKTSSEEAKIKLFDYFKKAGIPPDVAAKKIVYGIKKNRRRVLVKADAYVIDFISGFFRFGETYTSVGAF